MTQRQPTAFLRCYSGNAGPVSIACHRTCKPDRRHIRCARSYSHRCTPRHPTPCRPPSSNLLGCRIHAASSFHPPLERPQAELIQYIRAEIVEHAENKVSEARHNQDGEDFCTGGHGFTLFAELRKSATPWANLRAGALVFAQSILLSSAYMINPCCQNSARHTLPRIVFVAVAIQPV